MSLRKELDDGEFSAGESAAAEGFVVDRCRGQDLYLAVEQHQQRLQLSGQGDVGAGEVGFGAREDEAVVLCPAQAIGDGQSVVKAHGLSSASSMTAKVRRLSPPKRVL